MGNSVVYVPFIIQKASETFFSPLYFSVHNCLAEMPFVRASLQSLTFEQEDYIAYLLDFVLLGHLLGQLM